MPLGEEDDRAERSLRDAIAWAMPSLALLPCPKSLFEAVTQLLHWEGLDAFVLVPAGDGDGALTVASFRAAPNRRPAEQVSPDASAEVRRVAGAQAAHPGRFDGLPTEGPARAWTAAPLSPEHAFLVVEGERVRPAIGKALAPFAQLLGSLLVRIRETAALRERLEVVGRAQRTIVAEERLSVLGEAAAVLAHEMRNPLGTIQNALSLLVRDEGSRDLAVGVIREETDRLASLTRDLLHLARPLEPQRRPCELEGLAQASIERIRGRASRADLRYRLVSTPERIVASVDPSFVGLALENLLQNASQMSPPNAEVRVIVSEQSGHPSIAVEDEGPGVRPGDLARIFEPFFTTRAVGTGLGLPIVKRLVEAQGGDVRVGRSAAGGARFELVLRSR